MCVCVCLCLTYIFTVYWASIRYSSPGWPQPTNRILAFILSLYFVANPVAQGRYNMWDAWPRECGEVMVFGNDANEAMLRHKESKRRLNPVLASPKWKMFTDILN
jgi:hypothetical protein